jgi:cell division protein FtsZ
MAEILPDIETFARIKVVGVGGGGGNALNRMVQSKLRGIDFVAINTDAQALHYSQANKKVHIGKEATKGLGAGANPEIGRMAAEESEADIYEALKNSEMVFITYGSGGGTGSGAAPVVARIAKEIGALTVAIITKPFTFEGDRRRKVSDQGIDEIKDKVDTLIMIPNDRILQIIDRKTSLLDAFGAVDDILKQGVQGIADLITINGIVNLDFADVKSIMHDAGSALMGIGQGTGDTRAVDAVKQAIDSPLLEVSITGAKGVLINFTGGRDMGMHEVEEAAKLIHDSVDPEANIIFGTVIDENMTGEIRVTLVATGFDSERRSSSDYGIFSPTTTLEEAQSGVEHEDLPQDKFTPFLSNEQPKALFEDPAEPMVRAQPEDINISIEPDEEIIGFDLDEDVLEEESKKVPFDKTEPIVETVTSSRSYDDDEIDKPAFLREGKKISQSDSADDSDDDESMPSFIKRKL